MSTCPYHQQTDRLNRLLADDLPADEQARLTAHLEHCAECRRSLDALAARSGLWKHLPLLRDEELEASTEDLPEDLNGVAGDDEEVPLGLLEPTDESGLLGKLGQYDVFSVVGRGGMGIVFKARDRALDRLVAIKVLTPGLGATGAARRRFAREGKAAAAVVHEHVVTIHAVDLTPQGIPYLVMQYIAGKSVQDVIDRGKPPEVCEILRIGAQAASGLAAAHAQGLIHRDIKPANLLLENGVERVKITDFGLARAVDDATMTQSGVVAGTPRYMSPEQARGDVIDHRTDLFSLGSVLYALCTGRAPFRGRSSISTLKRVCEETPEPVGRLNPDIPQWLTRIIERLHAKDPEDRYGSSAEVADLLGRCLAHVQQPANVPLPAELFPTPRRRAVATWGTALACVLLVALLGISSVRAAAQQAVDYVATALRLKTPEGVLVIEANDPDVAIRIDDNDIVISGAGIRELRLPVGAHRVQTLKEGRTVREDLVTITRGGRKVLTVRREQETQPPPTAVEEPMAKKYWYPPARTIVGELPPDIGFPVFQNPRIFFKGLGSEVRTVCFSPNGQLLAYGMKSGRIGLLELNPRIRGAEDLLRAKGTTFEGHRGGVECVAFSPDGKQMLSGGWDHDVRLWDITGYPAKPGLVWSFAGFHDGVRSLAFSPDGSQLAVGGFDKQLIVLDASNGQRIWTSPTLDQPINGVAFSPDGHLIALAVGDYSKGVPGNPVGQAGEVQLWRWPARKKLTSFGGWTRECKSLSFSSRGDFLAATSGDGTVRVYQLHRPDAWQEMAVLQGGPWTAGVAFRPNAMQFASSNWSGQVMIWSLKGPSLLARIQAHDQNIPCIAYSSDGSYLATASGDGSIKVWDVSVPPAAPAIEQSGVGGSPVQETRRLVQMLRRNPPRPATISSPGKRLYVRDLTEGETTMIADSPVSGLEDVEDPDWSHDGKRIVFHATQRENWVEARIILLERREDGLSVRDIGAGCCPRFSADDQTIAFLLCTGEHQGVWLMSADGSNRRPLTKFGAPFWSPDGTQLLINGLRDPIQSDVFDLETKRTTRINVPGQSIFSWPRWASQRTLVACIGEGDQPDSIALLDVSRPAKAKVARTLWRRSMGPDTYARWPLFSPPSGDCFFIGDEGNTRTLYDLSPNEHGPGRLSAIETGGRKLSDLSLSPDGRYLLFAADRLDRKPPDRALVPARSDPVKEVDRLARLLKRNQPQPGPKTGERQQVYMRDVVDGGTTLIADEPLPGLIRTSCPKWSHDGRRILFHASPQPNDWSRSQMILLEARDGKPGFRSLGIGNCPDYAPDDRHVAFLIWSGSEAGVWVMNADGSNQRHLTDFVGAPYWSPQGDKLLLNSFTEPTECRILDLETRKHQTIEVAGHTLLSWPSWVGPDRVVAVVREGGDKASIALLDVQDPRRARILQVLWNRGPELNVLPRWPIYEAGARLCLFIGVEWPNRRNLYYLSPSQSNLALPMEEKSREDQLEGLSLSPGGRYLLFTANRPERR